ncbi:MAG: hypothetical protein JWQ21_2940 [Herminiimonas sp.]|nr:hypothetical protein [Herminiimonas sp.]
MEQSLYWKELFQLKVHGHYVECFLRQSENWDKSLSMFLAICSSASIGAWVVWKDYAQVWGLVIAISQIIQAVRPFLPYHERIKCLAVLRNSYAELFVFADSRWPNIAAGETATAEIAKLRMDIRGRKLQYEQKAFPSSGLPDSNEFLEKSTQTAEKYFSNFYGV